jgi:Dyp-type peroxidase family
MKLNKIEKLDPNNNQEHLKILSQLQGNILSGYDCDYTVYIFLKFKAQQVATTKAWIRHFATTKLISAQQQWEIASQTNHPLANNLFTNFLLSSQGYIYLGLKTAEETTWGVNTFWEIFFRDGLKNNPLLHDPPPQTWEPRWQVDIDALVSLAHNDISKLAGAVQELIKQVSEFAQIINIDVGYNKKSTEGHVIEHFGFRDGISQPLFFQQDIENSGSTEYWDPSAPLELVLVEEEDLCGNGQYYYGSYGVYRKLEQNVAGFDQALQELTQQLGLVGKDGEERTAALVMGRYRDGTPLNPLPATADLNNFNYIDDPHGNYCPLQAHSRKANPRGSKNRRGESLAEQRQHRIVRRGLSYWETRELQQPQPDETPDLLLQQKINFLTAKAQANRLHSKPTTDEDKVGLLFLCFQNSIFKQFVHIQSVWANDNHFATHEVGLDPIIGQPQYHQPSQGQWWSTTAEPKSKVNYNFSQFVTMTGGEFLFAPSLIFLQHLE